MSSDTVPIPIGKSRRSQEYTWDNVDDPEDADDLQRYADIGLIDACDATNCPEGDHIDRFLYRSSEDVALEVTDWWRDTTFVDSAGDDLSDHPAIGVTLSWSTR